MIPKLCSLWDRLNSHCAHTCHSCWQTALWTCAFSLWASPGCSIWTLGLCLLFGLSFIYYQINQVGLWEELPESGCLWTFVFSSWIVFLFDLWLNLFLQGVCMRENFLTTRTAKEGIWLLADVVLLPSLLGDWLDWRPPVLCYRREHLFGEIL